MTSYFGEFPINKEKVIDILTYNGLVLGLATDEQKDDIDIVITAVTQNGNALLFASDNLKDNIYVVKTAIKQNSKAIIFASDNILDNDIIIIMASMYYNNAFIFASFRIYTNINNNFKNYIKNLIRTYKSMKIFTLISKSLIPSVLNLSIVRYLDIPEGPDFYISENFNDIDGSSWKIVCDAYTHLYL
jgi:hypothetical protein